VVLTQFGHGSLLRGADLFQALHFGVHFLTPLLDRPPRAAADVQVEMDAILDHLGLGHALEEEPRSTGSCQEERGEDRHGVTQPTIE